MHSGSFGSALRLPLRLWHFSILTLAFVLPFELKSPWLTLGALSFTNVELAAGGALLL